MNGKTFLEFLAEKDEEFSYTIKSTADIHRPETFARIKLGLSGYKIREFELGNYRPLMKDNEDFPDEPNSACWEIDMVTSLPLDLKSAVQLAAMHARIHQAHIRIDGENGSSVDPIAAVHTGRVHQEKPEGYKAFTTAPDDFDPDPHGSVPKDAQSFVGQKRVADFMKELMTGRKEREKATREHEVYETLTTTHRGFPGLFEMEPRKGYYLVTKYTDGTVEINGPRATNEGVLVQWHEQEPTLYPYRDIAFSREAKLSPINEYQDYGVKTLVCEMEGEPIQQPAQQPTHGPVQGTAPMVIANPRVHEFYDSGEAYDSSQTDDRIHNGDILVAEQDKAIAILVEAWPVSVTASYGNFHTHKTGWDWSHVSVNREPGKFYNMSASYKLAVAEANKMGWPLFDSATYVPPPKKKPIQY